MNRGEHPLEGLSAYLDGALGPDERREIEVHLAACPTCARLLEDLRTLTRDLREEGIPDLPHGLEARVRRAVAGEPESGNVVPFRRRWKIPVTVAATLGAAALMVIAYRFLPMRSAAPAPVFAESPIEVPMREEKAERDEAPAAPKKQMKVAESPRRDVPEPEPAPAPVPGETGSRDDAAALLAPAGTVYRKTLTIEGGLQCSDVFRPYRRLLRRVGPSPEEAIGAADRFVRSLGGTIVAGDSAPFEREYEVRATDWPALHDHLRREGFATEEEPEAIPAEADCVGVRVDTFPETP